MISVALATDPLACPHTLGAAHFSDLPVPMHLRGQGIFWIVRWHMNQSFVEKTK